MERFPKIRFIVITILVITLINVVALAFILRFSFHEHRKGTTEVKKEYGNKGFDFLKQKLELSPDQEALFKNERDSFVAMVGLVYDNLEDKRLELVREFSKEKPDTTVLYSIADKMGVDHGELKRHVVDHFLKLRSYCNPDQLVKLDSMYNFMIRTDSPWRKKHGDVSHDNDKKKEETK
jgi:hypothetical protein